MQKEKMKIENESCVHKNFTKATVTFSNPFHWNQNVDDALIKLKYCHYLAIY